MKSLSTEKSSTWFGRSMYDLEKSSISQLQWAANLTAGIVPKQLTLTQKVCSQLNKGTAEQRHPQYLHQVQQSL